MGQRYKILVLVALGALAIVIGARRVNGGTFSRMLILRGYPVALAVDSRTSRAFVLDAANYAVDLVDTQTGALLGSTAIGNGASTLVVVEGANRVFIPESADGTVSVLDARSGTVARTVPLGFTPALTAVNAKTNRVYISDAAGSRLELLDGATGAILHRINLPAAPVAMAVNDGAGQLLIASADNTVRAFDAERGTLMHTTKLPGYPVSIAVDDLTDREFVVDPNDSAVIVIDGKTGTIQHATRVTENAITVAALSEIGKMVVASRAAIPGLTGSSAIDVLDSASGRRERTITMSESPNDILAGSGPDLFVDVGSSVLEFNTLNGMRVRSLPVRGARITAQGFAFDRSTKRLFVVSSDASNADSPPAVLTWARHWLPLMPAPADSIHGGVNEFGVGSAS